MFRFAGKVLLGLQVLGFVAAAGQPPANSPRQDPQFEARVLANQLQVRVTNSRGKLVTGLRKEDFLVLERGKSRPIHVFEARESTGVALSILVDVGSNMSQDSIHSAKKLIFDLVHLLEPDDEILTASYGQDVHFLHELTTNRKIISDGLWNLSTGARVSRWKRLGNLFVSNANTGYAIDESLLKLKKTRHADKVILVISAGFGNLGKATLDHLRLAGTQLFAVSMDNKLGDMFSLGGDQAARRRAVSKTGGITFSGKTILTQINEVRTAIKSYYLLGFSRSDRSGRAAIQVKVPTHPDYFVHVAPRIRSQSSFY